MKYLSILALSACLGLSYMVNAEEGIEQTVAPATKEKRHRHRPPAVAFQACENQAENASCQFTGKRGKTLTGQCLTPPRLKKQRLVCVPENAPHRHRHQE